MLVDFNFTPKRNAYVYIITRPDEKMQQVVRDALQFMNR